MSNHEHSTLDWTKLAALAVKGALREVVGKDTIPHAIRVARLQTMVQVLLPLSKTERVELVKEALKIAEAVT